MSPFFLKLIEPASPFEMLAAGVFTDLHRSQSSLPAQLRCLLLMFMLNYLDIYKIHEGAERWGCHSLVELLNVFGNANFLEPLQE